MTAPATSSSDNDILFRAAIDDQTAKFFEQFDARLKAMEATTSAGMKGVENSVHQSGVEIGLLGGVVAGLTNKLVEMALQGVTSFVKFVESSKDLRARVDTLGVSLNIVGQNAGYSKDQLAAYEKAVSKNGITTRQTRDALIQMAQSELDLDKASQLARVSQDAAVNAGVSSAEAFQRITYAIITLQPEILRNMNLTVDLQSEYSKFAAQQGKTAEQLSYTEKKQIALNAVLRQGETIAGTYEAAMGSVGKMLTSLERYQEQLQYELGGLFQPAYFQAVSAYKDALSGLLKFLEANRDSIEEFANGAGESVALLLATAKDLGAGLSDIGSSFGDIINMAAGDNNALSAFFQRMTDIAGLMTTLKQSIALARASLAGFFALIKDGLVSVEAFGAAIKALVTRDLKDFAEAKRLADEAQKTDGIKAFREAFAESMTDSAAKMNQYSAAADKASSSTSNFAKIQANKLADALATSSAKLKNLKTDLENAAAERGVAAQRQAIKDELQASWDREDRERDHQERIDEIMKSADEARKDQMKQSNEQRLKLEEDYQKSLQQLQEDFNFEAEELIRARDAVQLMALVRSTKKRMADEKKQYNERQQEIDKAVAENTAKMDESIQKQLKAVEDSYQKQLEAYQRNLDRQKQLKALQDQWEEEDRQKALRKQLDAILQGFASMDGATKEGLQQLLNEWGGYYAQLGALASQYMSQLAGARPTTTSTSGFASSDAGIRAKEKRYGQDLNGDGVIGQAGQISTALASGMTPSSFSSLPSQVPAVRPAAAGEHLQIDVNVAGSNLDPYIQRVLVNTLTEVVRNKGRV